MEGTGNGLTVTVADPLPVLLQLFASVTLVIVYVFVEEGLTKMVLGELLILLIVTGVVPSVYVMLHGCVPVNVTLNVAFCPLQIIVVPLIAAPGNG